MNNLALHLISLVSLRYCFVVLGIWYIASQFSLYPDLFLDRIPSLELLTLFFNAKVCLMKLHSDIFLDAWWNDNSFSFENDFMNDCQIFSEMPELCRNRSNRINLLFMNRPSIFDILATFIILSSLEVVFFICYICSSDTEMFDFTKCIFARISSSLISSAVSARCALYKISAKSISFHGLY